MDKTRKERTQKKRQLILDAALSVFLQNGYEKTKIIDIAQKAGIGKGTVYEYFDSKETLFQCLLNSYCQYYKETLQTTLSQMEGQSPQEKLMAILDIEHRLQKNVGLKSMSPLQFQMEFSHFPGLQQAVSHMIVFKFNTLRDILSDGIDAGELRNINTALAAVMLMGVGIIALDITDSHRSEHCPLGTLPLDHPISLEDRKQFTDENLVDLIMHGICAPR